MYANVNVKTMCVIDVYSITILKEVWETYLNVYH